MFNPLDLPMYFIIGIEGVFRMVINLPWPSGDEYLRLTLAFVSLYPVRFIARLMEKRTLRKLKHKEAGDHQTAVSSLDDLFHH